MIFGIRYGDYDIFYQEWFLALGIGVLGMA
jgi:hypothetical protein